MNWIGICTGVGLIIFGVYTLCFRNIDNFGTELVENTNGTTPTRQISIARLSVQLPQSLSSINEEDDSRSSISYRMTVKHNRTTSVGMVPIATPLMLPSLLTGEFEPFDDVSDIVVPANIYEDTNQPPPGNSADIVVTSSVTSSPVQQQAIPLEQ